jgi:regulatory protein
VNQFDVADQDWVNDPIEGENPRGGRRRKNARKGFSVGKKIREVEPGSLDLEGAREVALRILTRTQKSVHELEQALIKKGATLEVAAAVVERFVEVELLVYARLARGIVNTRLALKGESARAIRRELDRRGLSVEADDALQQLDREREFEVASELAVSRMRRLASLDRETRFRRLSSYLARKGYSGELVGKAIRHAEAQAKIEA